MKTYRSNTPRVASGFAALAMTSLTMALLVGAPALVDAGSRPDAVMAAVAPVAGVATEVTIIPTRIDVIATRDTDPASVQARVLTPKRKQQG
jgi:hypothetical protein